MNIHYNYPKRKMTELLPSAAMLACLCVYNFFVHNLPCTRPYVFILPVHSKAFDTFIRLYADKAKGILTEKRFLKLTNAMEKERARQISKTSMELCWLVW